MNSEHRVLMIKTRELIEHTRRELAQLREEIQTAQDTIDQSQRLLSGTGPSSEST
jgi:homoserine kinase